MRIEDQLKSPVAGDTGRWPKLKLSTVHAKLWEETRAAMLWVVPSFSDIWYAMMIDRDGQHAWFTDRIPTAATDDKYLYINPEWFFQLSLDERIFICCHEIEHAMFGHCGMFFMLEKAGHISYPDGVTLPVMFDLMNITADYVINAQLVEAKIGSMPSDGLYWPDLITGDMGLLDAYRLLYKRHQANKPKRRPGRSLPGQGNPCDDGGNSPGNQPDDKPSDDLKRTTKDRITQGPGTGKQLDTHLKPGTGRGKPTNEAMGERNEQAWANTIAAAIASGQLRGDMPASLIRTFKGQLTPKANWQDVYFAAITRKIGNDRYSWEQLNPQLIYRGIGAPGRVSFGCNLLVVAADSSGSITQHTLDVFLSESRAILEVIRPRRIIFTQCDARVHEWTEIDDVDDLRGEIKGGGGTAFEPVFERVEKEGEYPDMLIYLTDMDGSFPRKAPAYPVVWGSITKDRVAPFGEVVFVPPQHEEA